MRLYTLAANPVSYDQAKLEGFDLSEVEPGHPLTLYTLQKVPAWLLILVFYGWLISIWIGGWLLFLFVPQTYDYLNDHVGLPIHEWLVGWF